MGRKKEEYGKNGTTNIDFDNLLEAMHLNGIHSQKELSDFTGFKPATISNWKKGNRVNNGTIKELSKLLGVPEDFLTGKTKSLNRFMKEVQEHQIDLIPAKQFIESLGYKIMLRTENGKEQILFYSPKASVMKDFDQVHPDGFYITQPEQIEFLLISITKMTKSLLDGFYTSNLLTITDMNERIESK